MGPPSSVLPVPPQREPHEQTLAAANLRAALTLLEALRVQGVNTVVLCPGSRSGPLALAAGLLEPQGLRLLTGIDERSAAFWALGHSRASGRPAAVITTSGTAVANLLPAAVEADWGTIPLLLLSADRPTRLKGCGANQTVNQEDFLRCSVRWLGQGDGSGLAAMTASALQELARQAVSQACGQGAQPAGPVHLNLPFDEPLHCSLEQWQALAGPTPGAGEAAPTSTPTPQIWATAPGSSPDPDQPGVVVAGPWRGNSQHWSDHVQALQRWLQRSGWPLLADGLSGLRGLAPLTPLGGYDLVLSGNADALTPPQVLRLGPLPASRPLQRWLSTIPRQWLISEGDPRPLDPLETGADQWPGGLAQWCAQQPASLWNGQAAPESQQLRQRWQQADAAVHELLEHQLPGTGAASTAISEPALARALSQRLPAGLALVLANSSPVRDWERFADTAAPARPVFGFRGASGIDGTLSIACGVAEAQGQAVLLSGDLALLHDSNGWLWQQQLRGRLAVVLINNGGGGIFEQLPIRHPLGGMDFERLFAMPQAVDVGLLCAAHGVPHRQLASLQELDGGLAWVLQQRLAVLELRSDRQADAALRQRLRTMAQQLTQQP